MTVMKKAARWAVGAMTCAWLCAVGLAPARAADLDTLLACRKIPAGAARLACFDRESAALAAGAHASAPPTAAPTARNAPGLNPRQTFGLAPMQVVAREAAAERLPRQLDRLSAHIAALGKAPDGRELFTLDNHQVWAQLVPDGDVPAKVGDEVTISRGWLGSYWLSLQSHRGCKVTRIR